jgi:hypothetical protein
VPPSSQVAETNRERISRRQVDKFAERRAQLADAALQTLAELGYARTSLREIAQKPSSPTACCTTTSATRKT